MGGREGDTYELKPEGGQAGLEKHGKENPLCVIPDVKLCPCSSQM